MHRLLAQKNECDAFFAEVEVLLQKNWQSAYGRIHLCKEKTRAKNVHIVCEIVRKDDFLFYIARTQISFFLHICVCRALCEQLVIPTTNTIIIVAYVRASLRHIPRFCTAPRLRF